MTVAVRLLQVAVHVTIAFARMAVVAVAVRRRDALAREVARLLERLGGAFLKTGQLLATRVDVVGASETLSTTAGYCPPGTASSSTFASTPGFTSSTSVSSTSAAKDSSDTSMIETRALPVLTGMPS